MPPKASKAEPKPDDELVSLSQVNDLLQQQKETFMALLQQQPETFKGFVQMIMETNNTRIDSLTRELQDVKTSIEFTQKEVDELKNQGKDSSGRLETIQIDVFKVCHSLLLLTDKVEYLEGQSRRNNLVLDGIPDSPGETEIKVKKMLAEKVQLKREVEVERAHRTGKHRGERRRPIVVKLLRYKDRQDILRRTKSLKGTHVYIKEDFTDAVRRKRKELMPALRAARERGDIAYLRYDKLVTHPRTSTPTQTQDYR